MRLVWEAEGENGKDGGRSRQDMARWTMRSDYGERMRDYEIVFGGEDERGLEKTRFRG
jgi:hypothetical protein